jgi:hypothetical protein
MKEKFVSWLIKNYKNNDDPYGDLARDIMEDKKLNKFYIESYKNIRGKIQNINGDTTDALKALDDAYKIFKELK